MKPRAGTFRKHKFERSKSAKSKGKKKQVKRCEKVISEL